MRTFPKKTANSGERGVGLLEFALILPVLVVIVTGLIDYGHFIRQLNTLSLIARDAARTAAAHARSSRLTTPYEVPIRCDNPSATSTFICNGTPQSLYIRDYDPSDPTGTPDSVALAAKKAACTGLQHASYNADDFDIVPKVVTDLPIPGSSYSPQEVQIFLQLKQGRGKCLLCWGNMLAQLTLRADSVFLLEDTCQ